MKSSDAGHIHDPRDDEESLLSIAPLSTSGIPGCAVVTSCKNHREGRYSGDSQVWRQDPCRYADTRNMFGFSCIDFFVDR